MSRRRDAALALVVLVPLLAVRLVLGGPPSPWAVAAGVVGSLVVEGVLSLDAARVRRVWRSRRVRAAAVVAAFVGVALGVSVAGTWALTAAVAGLCTYLLVLLVVELRSRR
jgi:hypothetical protein